MAGQAPQHYYYSLVISYVSGLDTTMKFAYKVYYYLLVISYVSGLDTTLKFAYKDLTLVRANY